MPLPYPQARRLGALARALQTPVAVGEHGVAVRIAQLMQLARGVRRFGDRSLVRPE